MNSLSQDNVSDLVNRSGFTIIEVLIVLAIAALIMLIIFLSVPALQRSTRNHYRKDAVDHVVSSLQDYVNAVGTLPSTPAEGTDFINKYVDEVTNKYSVEFRGISGSHDYIPALDTIDIEYGHWCNRYSDGDAATDPIAGEDADPHAYVIWTRLEPDQDDSTTDSASLAGQAVFCVDNHS